MLLSKLHIRKLFPPWNCNLTKSWIKLKHKLTTNFNATLHYLNLFRIIIITNFTFFVFNNLVFWFCIALCFVLWSAIFSCTKYFLDKNLSRNKLRQKLAFEVVIIQIFCNIMNIKCYLWSKVFVFCTRIGEQWPEWQKELGGRWPLQWQKPWTPVLKMKK